MSEYAGKGQALPNPVPAFDVDVLSDSAVASVRDVRCRGECRHRSAGECAQNCEAEDATRNP